VRLHREILELQPYEKRFVDHINGDKLDNRRSNLRVVTEAQNRQNVPVYGGYSRFRGVSRSGPRWRARVTIDGTSIDGGSFATEEEAAVAARELRAIHMPFANEERSVRAGRANQAESEDQ
jgi:hypothetical protein